MDLEKLAANLRPREQAEAMDLGVRMLQAFFVPVALPWVTVVVPAAALLFFSVPGFWGLALVWWLLPFFDRLPLFVLSRGLFGDVPSAWRTVRETPRLWFRFVLLPLTLGRFSPYRCFHLPVSELEQQRGRRYGERCRVLRIDQDRGVLGLYTMSGLIVCALWAGGVGGLLGLSSLFDDPTESAWATLFRTGDPFGQIPDWMFAVGVGAMLLVEPFHVASGFALYINRRTHLEGWDIELTFRRMARRIAALDAGMHRAGLVLFVCLFGGALAGQGTQGVTPPVAERPAQDGDRDPQRVIAEVRAHPDFGGKKKVTRWRLRESKSPSVTGGPRVSGLEFVAEVFRILIWMAAIAAAVWLIWLLFKTIETRARGDGAAVERGPPPVEVMGLDVRPESLPDDPAAAAWALWQAGDAAGCLGLLYRASLADLIHGRGLAIGRSATEADCVALVGAAELGALLPYFRGLTAAWQTCAYAHRTPPPATARQLCDDWPRHFGRAA